MDTLTLQKIKDLLSSAQNIAVFVGKNPRIDDMAAGLSLYLALSAMNKKVTIACPSSPIVEISSLVGIDQVKTQLDQAGGDLVVSFPYRDGEIEKVSYTIDQGYLNIVVKAGTTGLTFNEKDIQYKHGSSSFDAVFVIGTPRLSDLGALFNPDALKGATLVNIDNKLENQSFGDIVLVSSNFSSVSEQVANVLTYLNGVQDIDIAQNLLSGIADATDNFQDPKTSYLAFETAAKLMKQGAVRIKRYAPQVTRPTVTRQQIDTRVSSSSMPPFMQKPDYAASKQPVASDFSQNQKPPSDWLTPKVYKGSTTI